MDNYTKDTFPKGVMFIRNKINGGEELVTWYGSHNIRTVTRDCIYYTDLINYEISVDRESWRQAVPNEQQRG